MKKTISILTCTILLFGQVKADIELPDLGSPSDVYLSKLDEPVIGRAYYRNLRQQGQVVEDPLLNEYIHSLPNYLLYIFLYKKYFINIFIMTSMFNQDL